jgi:hypothetical protein
MIAFVQLINTGINHCANFYRRHRFLVLASLLLIILIVVMLPYLLDNTLPVGFSAGDLSGDLRTFFGYSYLEKAWGVFYPSWDIFYSLPNYGLNVYSMLHYLFYFFFQGNIVYTYKLFIVCQVLACGLSMFFVVHRISENPLGALIAGLFYSLSPYFLGELATHIYFIWSYILLPIAFYFIYRALIVKSVKIGIIAGATAAFATIFAYLQNVYVTGMFMAMFAVLTTIFYADLKDRKGFLKSLGLRTAIIAVGLITFLLLSAYLILPSFSFNPILSGANASERLFQASILSNTLLQSFSLIDWAQPIMPFVLLLPVLSACLLLFEKNRIYYILAILGLFSVAMSLGPTTPLFTYSAKFLPLFDLIRVPIRFSITSCFVFSFMGGVSIALMIKKLKAYLSSRRLVSVSRFRKSPIVIALIFLLFVPVCYVLVESSLAYSRFGPLMHSESSSGLDSPEAYAKIKQYINAADPQHQYRVIDMASSNGQILTFDHKALSGYLVPLDLFFTAYHSPSLAKILSLYAVKYIITLDSANQYIGWNQLSYSDLNNALEQSPNFRKVYEVDDLIVFENQIVQPWIYLSYGALAVGGPQALSLFYSLNMTENWALMYANQVVNQSPCVDSLDPYTAIVFHDSDERDLVIQQSGLIQPWKSLDIYNPQGWDLKRTEAFPIDHPFFNVQNSLQGQFAYSEFFTYTNKITSLKTTFDITSSGFYSMWVRALKVNGTGSMSISIDSDAVTTANFSGHSGFIWIKTDPVYLTEGTHYMSITNNDDNPLYLDTIVPVSNQDFQNRIEYLSALINESDLKTLYLLEFANQFSVINALVTNQTLASSDLCLSMNPNSTAKTELYFASSRNYTVGLRVLSPSGNFKLMVDNKTIYQGNLQQNGEPTWTWVITQPISITEGVHTIEFENSKAQTTLDFMYLTSDKTDPALDGATPAVFDEEHLGGINFTQAGISDWQGNVQSNKQAFVIFLESFYGNSWSLQLCGTSQSTYPIPTSYIFNAFPISNMRFNQEITIHFTQPYLIFASYSVSVASFIAVLILSVFLVTKNLQKKIKKRNHQKNKLLIPKTDGMEKNE